MHSGSRRIRASPSSTTTRSGRRSSRYRLSEVVLEEFVSAPTAPQTSGPSRFDNMQGGMVVAGRDGIEIIERPVETVLNRQSSSDDGNFCAADRKSTRLNSSH